MPKTKLMGILNVTPDSFFDGECYLDVERAIKRGEELAKEGADFIDIGGESTRPYADPVDEQEECARVLPIIEELVKRVDTPLSIDTRKPKVAQAALEAGASFLNDVSGFTHPEMMELATAYQVPICVMHMRGEPQTMQNNPRYPEGIISHLKSWFEERTASLIKSGIKDENIYLDPGIGFGKSVADNLTILNQLSVLRELGFPLLIGISRKSFMGKLTTLSPKELLPTTLVLNALLMQSKVEILRVHDVKAHQQMRREPCWIG